MMVGNSPGDYPPTPNDCPAWWRCRTRPIATGYGIRRSLAGSPDRWIAWLYIVQTRGARMIFRKLGTVPAFLALFLLAACGSPQPRTLSLHAPLYATLPNGYEPLNPTHPSSIYAEAMADPGGNLVRYMERKRGHALNLLS